MEPRSHSSPEITSAANSQVKWLRELNERRGREAAGAFLVEGPRAVEQALRSGARPLRVAYSPDLARSQPRVAAVVSAMPPEVPLLRLGERALRSISDTVTAQGILAAFPMDSTPAIPHLDPSTALVLILDRIRDPGNVGTLLRSAAAAGAHAVLLSEGCADPYSPKVVRSSAGGIFGVPFTTLGWPEIAAKVASLTHRYGADARADVPYFEAELAEGCAILVGNEAEGLGAEALHLSSGSLSIPIESGVESLNAGVAGSLLLFEARRQRLSKARGA